MPTTRPRQRPRLRPLKQQQQPLSARRRARPSVARRKPRSGPDADSAARRATVDVGVQWEHPNPDEEVNEKSFKTRVTEYLADHQISKAVRLAGEADDDDDDDDDDDALAAQLESLNPLSVLAETEAVEMDTSVEDSSASSQPLSTAAAAHPPQSPRGDAGDQGTPSSRRKRRRRRSPNPEAATESPAADSETAASPQTPREQPRHSRRKVRPYVLSLTFLLTSPSLSPWFLRWPPLRLRASAQSCAVPRTVGWSDSES